LDLEFNSFIAPAISHEGARPPGVFFSGLLQREDHNRQRP
jgi:hypothetical protein